MNSILTSTVNDYADILDEETEKEEKEINIRPGEFLKSSGLISYKISIFCFKILLKKKVQAVTEMISAIGYDHHTISSPNNFAKINATGRITIICLAKDISIL